MKRNNTPKQKVTQDEQLSIDLSLFKSMVEMQHVYHTPHFQLELYSDSRSCPSRPSQQFVPASERYAASVQRNRQERRLKRQAELLALQGRSCPSRTSCTPYQEPQPCPTTRQSRTSPTRKVTDHSMPTTSAEAHLRKITMATQSLIWRTIGS